MRKVVKIGLIDILVIDGQGFVSWGDVLDLIKYVTKSVDPHEPEDVDACNRVVRNLVDLYTRESKCIATDIDLFVGKGIESLWLN